MKLKVDKNRLIASLSVVLLVVSGCKSPLGGFFGKKTDDTNQSPPGVFSDGTSILGNWSSSISPTTTTGDPSYAVTTTYSFDPTGVVRLELRDLHVAGLVCTGYGQYRVNGHDVVLYIQATSSSMCAFNAQIYLSNVQVLSKSIRFTDPTSGDIYNYFAENAQNSAPVGVWNFNGDGGIDYLFLDAHGYFIVQTTDGGQQYLLQGFYQISSNGMTLTFFSDSDPTHVAGDPLVFSQFVTDGNSLVLTEDTPDGQVSFSGSRL